MSDMTIEKAREIVAKYPDDCPCIAAIISVPEDGGGKALKESYLAEGFLEGHSAGHASRDPEVAELKKVIEERGYAFQEAQQKTLRELSAERETVEKLKEAAQGLMEMNGAQYTDENGQVNIETYQTLKTKLHALRLALESAAPGHSPEGKTL